MENKSFAQQQMEEEAEASAVQKAQLTILTSSPQWGMLRAFIESQIEYRQKSLLLTPITNAADVHKYNFALGECAFGRALITWVETQLGVSKETVELYRQALSEQGEE